MVWVVRVGFGGFRRFIGKVSDFGEPFDENVLDSRVEFGNHGFWRLVPDLVVEFGRGGQLNLEESMDRIFFMMEDLEAPVVQDASIVLRVFHSTGFVRWCHTQPAHIIASEYSCVFCLRMCPD